MAHVQLSLHDLSQLVVMQSQSGKSKDEIVRVLVARGWPETSAMRFVVTTLSEQKELAADAQAPDENQQFTNRGFSSEQLAWERLWIVVLVVLILIVCGLLAG